MFDIAPTELLLCAVVALVIIGPKDLPKALRFVGNWVGKARRMAGTFRTGLDAMMRESELKEMEEKWRAHNDAIMQAHPQISLDPQISRDAAPVNKPAKPPAPPVSAELAANVSQPANAPLPTAEP